MSRRGSFLVDREVFDHPRFAREPFTEREAWLWLMSEAAFRAHVRRVGEFTVALKRGQLAASTRYMAKAWQWSEARVRRFLARLQTRSPKIDALIDAASDAGVTIVTVLNYDTSQLRPGGSDAASDAPGDAAATQQRRKEEVTLEFRNEGETPALAQPSRVQLAFEIAKEVATLCGYRDLQHWPRNWCGRPHRPHIVETWLEKGFERGLIMAVCRREIAGKHDGPPWSLSFFEGPIASAFAKSQQRLPLLSVVGAQQQGGGDGRSTNTTEATRKLRAELAELAGRAAGDPDREAGLRGDAGRPDVRLLSSK